MSRILRRPMFRGGPVNSYNTGITSGLGEPGYADGGRVAARVGGFFNFSKPGGLLPTASYTGGVPQGGLTGLRQAYQSLIPNLPKTGNLIKGGAIPLSLAAAPFYMSKDPLQNYPEEEQLQKTAEELQQEYFGKPRRKLMEDIMSGTRSKAESPYTGFDYDAAQRRAKAAEQKYFLEEKGETPLRSSTEEDLAFATGMGEQKIKEKPVITTDDEMDIEDILDEKKIKREAKLYEKLLGGEEARSQSIYDALLAASPAFFKGKNLREAAPQVLESINKSGAFDKPRDIRQAAAQLAIQRRIAVETAKAKSDDQLTRLEKQLSAKDTVLNKLSRIPGIQRGDYAGDLQKLPTSQQELSLLPPDKYFSIGNDVYQTIGQNVKDKTGKLVKITFKISKLG